MFEKEGNASVDMVKKILPSQERRRKGPYALFECFQQIPCNPCASACKMGAVEIAPDINAIPRIDYEKCTGCGLCIRVCPGLACFVVNEIYSETEAVLKLPYEYLPLPDEGQIVKTLDRSGSRVGEARVISVSSGRDNSTGTSVITIALPKAQATAVRGIEI